MHTITLPGSSQHKTHHTTTTITTTTDGNNESAMNSNNSSSTRVKEYTSNESYVLFLQLLTRVFRTHAMLHARRGKHSLRQTPTRNEIFLTSKPVRRLHSFLSHCDLTDVFGSCRSDISNNGSGSNNDDNNNIIDHK